MARWNRKKYPPNWEDISHNFRASRNFTCEVCGYKQGDLLKSKMGRLYKGSVDAAHKYPFDEANPDPELFCMCKRDHRIYDNQFQDVIADAEHQAILHAVALEREGYVWCDDCQGFYLPHEH